MNKAGHGILQEEADKQLRLQIDKYRYQGKVTIIGKNFTINQKKTQPGKDIFIIDELRLTKHLRIIQNTNILYGTWFM